MSDICRKIAAELKNQYVLGYRPTNSGKDGAWRKIKVKVNTPKEVGLATFEVSHKKGYYAPSGDEVVSTKKKS
jgi:Ca-activated chloride channel family protein